MFKNEMLKYDGSMNISIGIFDEIKSLTYGLGLVLLTGLLLPIVFVLSFIGLGLVICAFWFLLVFFTSGEFHYPF